MFFSRLLSDIFILEEETDFPVPTPTDKTDHYREELGKLFIDTVLVGATYDDLLAKTIEKFKYYSYPEYAEKLLPFYRSLIKKDGIPINEYTLVSIPMHWSRYWLRGFDHMMLLARLLSKEFSIPYEAVLKRKRYTKRQSFLDREKRLENVQNSFSIRGRKSDIAGRKFILLDDIISTGSTANVGAKLLKEYGAKEVRGYFIASGN